MCNFCEGVIDFIIKYDKARHFRYCWLQSDYAKRRLKSESTKMESIILLKQNKLYKKSDAVFYIVRHLSFPYKMLYVFSFFPNFIKDFIYDCIAKYRYKIFGKKISCEIPNDKKRELFIF